VETLETQKADHAAGHTPILAHNEEPEVEEEEMVEVEEMAMAEKEEAGFGLAGSFRSFPPSSSSYFLVAIIIICWCLHNPTSLPLPRGPTLATLHRHRHRPASSVTSLFGPPKSVPSNGCGHRLILPTGQLDVCITVNGVQPPECPRERPSRERAPPDARGIGIEMGIVMGMEMPGMTTQPDGWM